MYSLYVAKREGDFPFNKFILTFLFPLCLGILYSFPVFSQIDLPKGDLLYENSLDSPDKLRDWVLEGPAELNFKEDWMHMFSPNESGHHVFWCPQDFPSSFVAQWEMQNRETDAGLCIIFFAATGVHGEDIFDSNLKKREGIFRQYTKSDLHTYHISYYANAAHNPNRPHSHLRKNKGFFKVQEGEQGIPPASTQIHRISLVKDEAQIQLYVDERKIIDWTDDGKTYGPVLEGGKIGFRQMKWTHFRYRNFNVWGHAKDKQASWPRWTIDNTSSGADGVKLGDVNGDGRMDIVTGWEEGGITKVYVHPGTDKVKEQWPGVVVGKTPQVEDAVFADLDGDGLLEVVSSTEGNTQQVIAHWAGTGDLLDPSSWQSALIPSSNRLTRWMYAEPLQVDRRGNVDLVIGGKRDQGNPGKVGWFEAPRKGRQWEKWKWHEIDSVGWIMSLVVQDMDGDGDQDILMTDRYGRQQGCRWLENPGKRPLQKTFWNSHWVGGQGLEVMFMTIANILGDSKQEIIVPERSGNTLRVFEGAGSSWEESIYKLPLDIGKLKAVEAGDINGDGKNDLVISTNTYGPGKVGLFWVDGHEIWENKVLPIQSISGVHEAKYDQVILWDIDEDGDLDVLTCEENYGENSEGLGVIWYENEGR